jgi:hypothetical protein
MTSFEDCDTLGALPVMPYNQPILIQLDESSEFCQDVQKLFADNQGTKLQLLVQYNQVCMFENELAKYQGGNTAEYKKKNRIRVMIGGVMFYLKSCSKLLDFRPWSDPFKTANRYDRMRSICGLNMNQNTSFQLSSVAATKHTNKFIANPYGFLFVVLMYNKDWLPHQVNI